MGLRAWAVVVMGGVAVAGVVNACASSGQPNDTQYPDQPSGGSSGQNTTSSSGGSSGSSGGSGSSSGSSSGTTEDATLSDDTTTTGDDGGNAGDDGGDAGMAPPPPTCAAGQTCVDVVPAGWTGYVQVLIGAADAGAEAGTPPCAGPYGAPQGTGIVDPVGVPADCSSCDCLAGDAGPITCSVGVATQNYGCLPPDGPTTPAVQNTCVPVSGANGSATAPTVTSASGTCAPSSALAPPSATPAVACALTTDAGTVDAGDAGASAGTTCAATQACAFPITAPSGSPGGVCIYQSGVQSCPLGSHFSQQHVVGSAIVDNRGCSCSCAAPKCPADGFVTGYASNDCSGNTAITIDAGTVCKIGVNIHNAASFIYHPSHGAFDGKCSAVDAGPSGAATIDSSGATTYCCIP